MRPTATYVFRTIPTILTTRQNPREACAVLGDDGEKFTIAVFKGAINADRHSMSARITRLGVPLLRLCVNGSTHTNPDGERISGTHWHIYKEGEDDWNAQTADIESPDFVNDTIRLLDRFNVIRRPDFQEKLI